MDWISVNKKINEIFTEDHKQKVSDFITRLRMLSSGKLTPPTMISRDEYSHIFRWGVPTSGLGLAFFKDRVYWEIDSGSSGFGSTVEYDGHIPKMLEDCLKKYYGQNKDFNMVGP